MDMNPEQYLEEIPMWAKQKNSLEDVRALLHEMGDPDERMKLIHVAGTNGKGSVCADLTSILTAAGYRVGTFISPHLTDIRERFLFNGQMIDEATFAVGFDHVLHVVTKMREKGYVHPTYFEFLFLMAMSVYDSMKPDFVILETGMGGRLDTTNVIRHPLVCVITSISMDHTQYLGETIEMIAAEKAGIIKEGIPVVFDDICPEAVPVILDKAKEMHAAAYAVHQNEAEDKSFPEKLLYRGRVWHAPYQVMNARLAGKALQILDLPGVTDAIIDQGLGQVRWPGRMEEIAPDVWMDGAHNIGGIQAAVAAMQWMQRLDTKQLTLVFAVVSDKDYVSMIDTLADGLHPKQVQVLQMSSARAVDADSLGQLCRKTFACPVTVCKDEKSALIGLLEQRQSSDRILIIGSLYLIGELKKILDGRDA